MFSVWLLFLFSLALALNATQEYALVNTIIFPALLNQQTPTSYACIEDPGLYNTSWMGFVCDAESGRIKKLRASNCAACDGGSLVRRIVELYALNELYLQNSSLHSIVPPLPPNLFVFVAYENQFDAINITSWGGITHFDVARSPLLVHFDVPSFANSELRALVLNDNPLLRTTLPSAGGWPPHLETLNLYNTPFYGEFPSPLPNSTINVRVWHCNFTGATPFAWGTNLFQLDLSFNQFTSLQQPARVVDFNAAHNQIASNISAPFPAVCIKYNISHNLIRRVDANPAVLTSIDVSHNDILTWPQLPGTFLFAIALQHIDISHNPNGFGDFVMAAFPVKLRTFIADYTLLPNIPTQLSTAIRTISVEATPITAHASFPATLTDHFLSLFNAQHTQFGAGFQPGSFSLQKYPYIRYLYLSNASFANNLTLPVIWSTSLELLDVSLNAFVGTLEPLESLASLRVLRVNGNRLRTPLRLANLTALTECALHDDSPSDASCFYCPPAAPLPAACADPCALAACPTLAPSTSPTASPTTPPPPPSLAPTKKPSTPAPATASDGYAALGIALVVVGVVVVAAVVIGLSLVVFLVRRRVHRHARRRKASSSARHSMSSGAGSSLGAANYGVIPDADASTRRSSRRQSARIAHASPHSHTMTTLSNVHSYGALWAGAGASQPVDGGYSSSLESAGGGGSSGEYVNRPVQVERNYDVMED